MPNHHLCFFYKLVLFVLIWVLPISLIAMLEPLMLLLFLQAQYQPTIPRLSIYLGIMKSRLYVYQVHALFTQWRYQEFNSMCFTSDRKFQFYMPSLGMFVNLKIVDLLLKYQNRQRIGYLMSKAVAEQMMAELVHLQGYLLSALMICLSWLLYWEII